MKRKITGIAMAFILAMFALTGCVARYGYAAPPPGRVIVVSHPYRVIGVKYRYHPARVVYTHPHRHRY